MSTLKDHAGGNVLPEYTDEALSNPNGFFQGEVRALLLLAPPDQRQNVLAEQYRRMYRTVTTWDRKTGMAMSHHQPLPGAPGPVQCIRQILSEQGWLRIPEGSEVTA